MKDHGGILVKTGESYGKVEKKQLKKLKKEKHFRRWSTKLLKSSRVCPIAPRKDFCFEDDAKSILDWDYNVLQHDSTIKQLDLVVNLSNELNISNFLNIEQSELANFYKEVQDGYQHGKNVYHNFFHALDVTQSVVCFLRPMNGQKYVAEFRAISLFIASLCHDIAHPGVSSQFLINSGHSLSLQYDNPILENMHVAETLKLIQNNNIFKNLGEKQEEVINTIKQSILYTNMRIHSEVLTNIELLLQRKIQHRLSEHTALLPNEDQVMFCGFLLHVADVSNPTKKWQAAKLWTDLVMSEFFQQGILEKENDLIISSFCDPDRVNCADMQLKFVTFILLPSLIILEHFLPNVKDLYAQAYENKKMWEDEMNRSLTEKQMKFLRYSVELLKSEDSKKQSKMYVKWQKRLNLVLKSKFVAIMMPLFSVYALFASDIYEIFFASPSNEILFGTLTFSIFCIFCVEILISLFVNENFFNSFFFYLDIISTISMLADIGWIWNGPINSNEVFLVESIKNARASRVFRAIKLIRLFRIASLYEHVKTNLRAISLQDLGRKFSDNQIGYCFTMDELRRIFGVNKAETLSVITRKQLQSIIQMAYIGRSCPNDAFNQLRKKCTTGNRSEKVNGISCRQFLRVLNTLEAPMLKNKQIKRKDLSGTATRIGRKLADITIQRVIVLVLTFLVLIPQFSILTEIKNQNGEYGLQQLHRHATNWNMTLTKSFILHEIKTYSVEMRPVFLEVYGVQRNLIEEILLQNSVSYFNSSKAILAKYRLAELFVYEAHGCGVYNEANCKSISIVNKVALLQAEAFYNMCQTLFLIICFVFGGFLFTRDTHKTVILPVERMVLLTQQLAENPLSKIAKSKSDSSTYEIKLLEDTLTKIASLVQIGYGEAGASIISGNMKGGTFDPMVPGVKVHAAFGFCDIRRFTDTTECLKEDIMIFTNLIGSIIHEAVHYFEGSSNKNVGDAFLLVWKIPQKSSLIHKIKQGPEHLAPDAQISFFEQTARNNAFLHEDSSISIVDCALFAFLKAIIDLRASEALLKYAANDRLKSRFDNSFKVSLGYGLHVGWAIEGGIGSHYKIDPTYLSTDVNMASILEETSKYYGVPLLLSHSFYNLLSCSAKEYCRLLDCVLFSENNQPTGIYSCEIYNDSIKEFCGEKDLKLLRVSMNDDFFEAQRVSVNAYLRGKWDEAKSCFNNIFNEMGIMDVPSKKIYAVMSEKNFQSPPNWKGYRNL